MSAFDEEDEFESSVGENPIGENPIGESSDAGRKTGTQIPNTSPVKRFDADGGFDAASDVHRDTLRAFVVCVVYANAAVLLIFLGPMLWFFEGWTRIGAVVLVAGIIVAIRTYQTYREWDRSREDREGVSGTAGGDEEGESVGDDGDADGERGSTPEA